jgi:uncharacterized protein YkwD
MPVLIVGRRSVFVTFIVCSILALVIAADAGARDRLLAPEHFCPNPALNAPPRAQIEAMLCYHRYARRRVGLPSLRTAWPLSRSAVLKARMLNGCRCFTHTPRGRSMDTVFRSVGYIRGNWTIGENLGWGSGDVGGVRAMFLAWLRSPGHRENIIRPGWREIGIARLHVPHLFGYDGVTLWVTHFGSH